jgi:hypothetical protein
MVFAGLIRDLGMKTYTAYLIVILLAFCSCKKEAGSSSVPDPFTKYTIREGQQYCDGNGYVPVSYSELKFTARFDSSAIYTTIDPGNQDDINKLYGFSDNNTDHHQFSARFGWRWSNSSLRLFGYVYNNGSWVAKELGVVAIGADNSCSIKVTPTQYIFTLNSAIDSLPRLSTTATGSGYKLFPYFGGNEVAPHDVRIWIHEL